MGVQFKLAEREDIAELVDLMNECFDETTSYDFARKVFLETENDPNQIHLIGLHDSGKIAAYCKITIIPCLSSPMETFAIFNHVCVKPEFRREHIGTQLMQESERLAREHGANMLALWSGNQRQPAHALYKKFGFEIFDGPFFEKILTDVPLEGGAKV